MIIAKVSHFLQETNTKYHTIHIIEALTTGALNHTKIVKKIITIEIKINLTYGGKNLKT
ncbi:MAG: hypothetical protein LBD88_00455 [Candidatus Peribacteria bacterium]|jgi:hypothetical protein|nr:hypothetical protein [Candidatus Peribacteria bacterium]